MGSEVCSRVNGYNADLGARILSLAGSECRDSAIEGIGQGRAVSLSFVRLPSPRGAA